jgi:hypothetical protein
MGKVFPDIFLPQQIGISYEHFKLHQGEMFNVSIIFTNTAAAGIKEVTMECPSGQEQHVKMAITGEFKAELYLKEACTVTANGTGITAFNLYRGSSIVSSCTFYHTPTAATGTTIDSYAIGSGGFRGGVGGEARREAEWILEDDKYLIRAKNTSATTSTLAFNFQYYRVTE